MKSKAFVLVNLIITMTFLNIILLSAFTIQKRLINSSFIAVQNKATNSYIKSKDEIIDFELIKLFEQILPELEKENKYDGSRICEKVDARLRSFNFWTNTYDYSNMRTSVENNSKVMNGNILSFDISYKYDDFKRVSMYYELTFPTLQEEDINLIKQKNYRQVYEKYKDSIITKKIRY